MDSVSNDFRLGLSEDGSIEDSDESKNASGSNNASESSGSTETSESEDTSKKTASLARNSFFAPSIEEEETSASTSTSSASQTRAAAPASTEKGFKKNIKNLTTTITTITDDIKAKASTDTIIKRSPATIIGVIGLALIVTGVVMGIVASGGALFPIVLTMLVLGSLMAATAANVGAYHSIMKNAHYTTLAEPFNQLQKKTEELKNVLENDSLDVGEKKEEYKRIKKEIYTQKENIQKAIELFEKNEFTEEGKIKELLGTAGTQGSINLSNLKSVIGDLEKNLAVLTQKPRRSSTVDGKNSTQSSSGSSSSSDTESASVSDDGTKKPRTSSGPAPLTTAAPPPGGATLSTSLPDFPDLPLPPVKPAPGVATSLSPSSATTPKNPVMLDEESEYNSSTEESEFLPSSASKTPPLTTAKPANPIAQVPYSVGVLGSAWQFPSDHLPVGGTIGDIHYGLWNILDSKAIGHIYKNGQGLDSSRITKTDYPTDKNTSPLTAREDLTVKGAQTMMAHPTKARSILALQEVSPLVLNELKNRLDKKYRFFPSEIPEGKSGNIFIYDSEKFTLVGTPIQTRYKCHDGMFMSSLKLQRKGGSHNGEVINFVQTHVPGGGNKDKGKEEFSTFLFEHTNLDETTVVMGDMNDPGENYLTAFQKTADAQKKEQHFSHLQVPYPTHVNTSKQASWIDNIFISNPKKLPTKVDDKGDDFMRPMHSMIELLQSKKPKAATAPPSSTATSSKPSTTPKKEPATPLKKTSIPPTMPSGKTGAPKNPSNPKVKTSSEEKSEKELFLLDPDDS